MKKKIFLIFFRVIIHFPVGIGPISSLKRFYGFEKALNGFSGVTNLVQFSLKSVTLESMIAFVRLFCKF